MGGLASLHFFAKDPGGIIEKLAGRFGGQESAAAQEKITQGTFISALITGMAQSNLDNIEDPEERRNKEAALRQVTGMLSAQPDEKAVVIRHKDAVSLYDESIRVENMERAAKSYSKEYGATMGFSLYDGNNLVIVAADAGAIKARGFYWLDEDDISPLDIGTFREVLGLDTEPEALEELLAGDDGEAMTERLEQVLALTLLIFPEHCSHLPTLSLIHTGPGCEVYNYIGT